MASGPGKNQGDNQTKEPVDVLPEEPKEAAAAAAAAAELPPNAPPSVRLQERYHGPPGAGVRNLSAVAAAEAVAWAKGKAIVAPSWRGSASGKPRLPPASRRGSASGKPPLPPRAIPKAPLSAAEVVQSGMMVRAKWKRMRDLRIDMKEQRVDMTEVFDELRLDCGIGETSQKAEPQGMKSELKDQVKSLAICPKKVYRRSLWRKFFDRIGKPNRNSRTVNRPHVSYETIPMVGMITHYRLLEMVAGQGVEFSPHALNLPRTYSGFRPVLGDGECFYRSFIFSYLEQVIDRQDTHEEHRLLVAVQGVSRQHTLLGCASEFSRSHKAFKKLIKKVMRWKRRRRWKLVPTPNSYRKEKLLEFFSSNNRTIDIFAFLRLVAAIWICSHSEEYEPRVTGLSNEYTLTDWCFEEVIQHKVFTDHIQITALATALGVPLRVESLFQDVGQDIYTDQGSQDDGHEVPRVTLLHTQEHYDIIYPGKAEGPTAAGPSQHQGASCSGEKSGEQTGRVAESPTGGDPDQHTARGEIEPYSSP